MIYTFEQIQNIPKTAGVYSIVNILNGDRYIGSTINFYDRLIQHRAHLRRGIHHSIILQRAYNKYGECRFIVQILETCQPIRETLLLLEQKYLDLKPKYNISPFANRPCNTGHKMSEQTKNKLRNQRLGKKRDEETKRKMKENRKIAYKPLYMYDLQGNFVMQFKNKYEVLKVLPNVNIESIICSCTSRQKSCNGYMWSHKKADKILPYKKDNAKRIKCQKLDDFGNVLEEFDSFKDAALSLGKKPHSGDQISLCARGKYNKMYGFKWRIKNDK